MSLHLQRLPDGSLCLAGMDEHWRHVLASVPALLAEPQPPAVRERLLPTPSSKESINRDWRELIAPELEALWRANHELMAADLGRLEKDTAHRKCWRVVFPANHAAAWLSVINQARLVLGSRWDVTEKDMIRPAEDLKPTERDHDIFLIHLLAYVEQLFIETEEGSNQ
ncbi:MAG: DUF2017 family protein [Verrucomicrobiia bacterium]